MGLEISTILKMMLDFGHFEGGAGILTILKMMLDLDDFEGDVGFQPF